MKEVLSINGSFCSKFSNALHTGFHNRIYQRINEEEDKTKIHVDDALFTEYGNLIADETELNRESRVSAVTGELAEIDAERDGLVSYLLNTISAAAAAPLATVKAAGVALEAVTRPYKKIQTAANDAETNLIDGLLNDLRKSENSPHVLTLNLSDGLSALDDANRRFVKAQTERTATRVANQRTAMKEVRLQTDAVYQRICDLVYASELLCAVPEDLPVIEALIKDINGIVFEYKTSYNQSQGQKNKKDDKPIV